MQKTRPSWGPQFDSSVVPAQEKILPVEQVESAHTGFHAMPPSSAEREAPDRQVVAVMLVVAVRARAEPDKAVLETAVLALVARNSHLQESSPVVQQAVNTGSSRELQAAVEVPDSFDGAENSPESAAFLAVVPLDVAWK